jgi:hypothetical protein
MLIGFHLIIIIVIYNYMYVCECTVVVDVGDGTTSALMSILSNIAMGRIVLGRQMNVYFSTVECMNAMPFVGMDVCCFCTMKIHDSINIQVRIVPVCPQTMISIVVHCAVVQSCFCICITTEHPIIPILHEFTLCCF